MNEHLIISRKLIGVDEYRWVLTTNIPFGFERNLLISNSKLEVISAGMQRARDTNATLSVFDSNGIWSYSQEFNNGKIIHQTDREEI